MNLFFTVDTEFHPLDGNWSEEKLTYLVRRDIDGVTPDGEFGAFYQSDLLRQYGLKAVFFVEALSGYVAGTDTLKRIVNHVQAAGHEVGLHLHPEWLRRAPWASILPGKEGSLMRSFCEDDQTALIAKGIEQLRRCGVERVHSFRAGSYGANLDTLRALARNGVRVDSSHNLSYLGTTSDIQTDDLLLQPKQIHGVYEFPVACFHDWSGHWRHAQLCACSSRELENALLQAWAQGWHSFVIVSHSFEMIKRGDERSSGPWSPDKVVIRRFKRLCEFLDANRKKFQTTTFAEFDFGTIPSRLYTEPLSGFLPHTLWRLLEQAYRRL